MFDSSNLAILALAAVAGGGGYATYHAMQTQPGVYEQPLTEVYQRLATADLQFVGAQFDGVRFDVSGNGRDKVFWSSQGMAPERSCTIALSPIGEDTHAAVRCSQPLADAEPIVRLRDELFANSITEMVEATITGDPIPSLDKQMYEGAATALGGSSGGGYNRMLGDAVATRRAIDQQLSEMAAEQQPEALEAQRLDSFYDESAEENWTNLPE